MGSASLFEVNPDRERTDWKDLVHKVYSVDIADAQGGSVWDRLDRLADSIASVMPPPDIISLTETEGWRWCSGFGGNVGDYDAYDRLIAGLTPLTGVEYRIAYMVGNVGGFGRCSYFGGDAVLYNPARLINQNVTDPFGIPQEIAHDSVALGVHRKRSLPICNPGSARMPLTRTLIDGLPQTDKCPGSLPPSGPAWVLQFQSDATTTPATLVRFSFRHDTRYSFDVITVHPHWGDEFTIKPDLLNFVRGLQLPPYRTGARYYPALLIGDLNRLKEPADSIPDFSEIYRPVGDAMVVRRANRSTFPSIHDFSPIATMVLPNDPTQPFSDHIGLAVRLGWMPISSRVPVQPLPKR
jgi:hypothetical protein